MQDGTTDHDMQPSGFCCVKAAAHLAHAESVHSAAASIDERFFGRRLPYEHMLAS